MVDLKRVADTSGAAGGAALATACFARLEEMCAAGSSARGRLRAAPEVRTSAPEGEGCFISSSIECPERLKANSLEY